MRTIHNRGKGNCQNLTLLITDQIRFFIIQLRHFQQIILMKLKTKTEISPVAKTDESVKILLKAEQYICDLFSQVKK